MLASKAAKRVVITFGEEFETFSIGANAKTTKALALLNSSFLSIQSTRKIIVRVFFNLLPHFFSPQPKLIILQSLR